MTKRSRKHSNRCDYSNIVIGRTQGEVEECILMFEGFDVHVFKPINRLLECNKNGKQALHMHYMVIVRSTLRWK